ncbi:FMN reductase (NADPH) [Prauserella marina]|uniref:FMN reductase n=1 Tax=Prauserella marina TaxID=530584 RepID=A0A222VQ84_9PSEU|nr:NADPH-dependent FMN reductase [Prauserella marina]ASR35903.1 FMN reductase (NADPH) [Prauserella marina]PWV84173.1 SsuE family FMN reductase [Prauserella marina]SDC28802.1 FMN reductase [Prauserella marina]
MSRILALSGSPSRTSKTEAVLEHLAIRLRGHGHTMALAPVRELPASALLAGDAGDPDIAALAEAIAGADGLIVASPVYKAAYSGLLKSLLDLLPQFALEGKTVLPLATGGSLAHVLAIDYAFRPVLHSMGAEHVIQGYFLLDRFIEVTEGGVLLAPEAEPALLSIVDFFSAVLSRRSEFAAA